MEQVCLDSVVKQLGNINMNSNINSNILSSNTRMNYSAVETMAFHLSLQLHALEERGYSLLFLQANDILQANNDILQANDDILQANDDILQANDGVEQMYILRSFEQLVPLHKKDASAIVLNYPAVYPLPMNVCAPEVLKMSALPFITHKSASYYSLALLCLKMLGLTVSSLDELCGTKLYYFLERCLKEEPKERILIGNLLAPSTFFQK